MILVLLSGSAQACSIAIKDLTAPIRSAFPSAAVLVTQREDADSGEPVRSTVMDPSDGTLLVLEQRHCEIRNITVTLLSPDSEPGAESVARLSDLLALTETWREAFPDTDARAALHAALETAQREAGSASVGFYRSVDDVIASSTETSEAVLTFVSSDSPASQFSSILTLYIGVGGL